MATNTRNKANAPESDAPAETDIPTEPTEPTEPTDAPTTDEPTETVEEDVPTLPADFTTDSPQVQFVYDSVKEAVEHKDDPTPILDFVANADVMFATPTGFSIVDALPETDRESAMDTYDAFKAFVDTLRNHVERADRDEVDMLLNGLVALASTPRGGIDSQADKDIISVLAAVWATTEPKGRKGSGSGSRGPRGTSDIPALKDVWGFKAEYQIRSKCDVCGTEHTTRKDNLNSQRDALIGHKANKCRNKVKMGAGTQAYAEATKALFSLGLGDSDYKGKHVDRDNLLDAAQSAMWHHTVIKS